MNWESGLTKQAKLAEENALLRSKIYALEERIARLEREAKEGLATIDRLMLALAEKGAK